MAAIAVVYLVIHASDIRSFALQPKYTIFSFKFILCATA
jgi:hypothetical protein